MKMEKESFSETLVTGENSTLRHNSEDDILKEGASGYIQLGRGRTPIQVQCRKFISMEPHTCSQNFRYISEFLTFLHQNKETNYSLSVPPNTTLPSCVIISINCRKPQDIFTKKLSITKPHKNRVGHNFLFYKALIVSLFSY